MIKEKVATSENDEKTGLSYRWEITVPGKGQYDWKGFYTGPLVLSEEKVEDLCKKLLGIDISELTRAATEELRPVPSLRSVGASVIMHSTTPDLKTFDGDLDKVIKGVPPTDYTSYKEARAVYLAVEGDLAVGRIKPWKTAVKSGTVEAVELPGVDYYYLSHALLALAESHLSTPSQEVDKMIAFLKEHKNATIRLYALEKEMQLFLIWLKRQAGLDYLLMDANSPEVARDWNRKSVLFPPVEAALGLEPEINSYTPQQILEEEAKHSLLRRQLGCVFPVLPGYTLVRKGSSPDDFTRQLLTAAQLLQKRYGLSLGCLKAADSGDGARITPGIDLKDVSNLKALAADAHRHGDDYILEPHIHYNTITYQGETLKISPSAHIRWGEVATGITLQFTEGTSWKGNVYIDENTTEAFGISQQHYQDIINCMNTVRQAFHSHKLGLTIAGLDFAIGRIGGFFGDDTCIGIQDPNISFSGAECLRVFLEKTRTKHQIPENTSLYGATRIFKPSASCDFNALQQFTAAATHSGLYADAIAAIPERWAMIAVAHRDPDIVITQLQHLLNELLKQNLSVN